MGQNHKTLSPIQHGLQHLCLWHRLIVCVWLKVSYQKAFPSCVSVSGHCASTSPLECTAGEPHGCPVSRGSRSCSASGDGVTVVLFVKAGLAFFAVLLLTFSFSGHVAAGCFLVVSFHVTMRIVSSQSLTFICGSSKLISATLHFTRCLLKVAGTSDFKVTVMLLAQPGWRCPT